MQIEIISQSLDIIVSHGNGYFTKYLKYSVR